MWLIVSQYLLAINWKKEVNVLFNDTLNTFYLRLYGDGHMVEDHSDSNNDNNNDNNNTNDNNNNKDNNDNNNKIMIIIIIIIIIITFF